MANDTKTSIKTPLTPAQVKVVVALAGGQTVTEAARSVGLSRTTIHKWLAEDTDFISKYDTIRQTFEDELIDQIVEIRALALKKLRSILEDAAAPPAVQLRAALAVLKDTLHPPAARARAFAPDESEQNPTLFVAAEPPAGASCDNTEQKRTLSAPAAATPRNAPCPCGSGGKFKRCCGRNAPPVLSAA